MPALTVRLHSLLDMIPRHAIFPVLMLAALAVNGTWLVLAPAGARAQQAETLSNEARIAALEERITELQAVIGTLQTFIRDGGGAAAPAAGAAPVPGSGDGGPSELSIRVHALETQISALTAQMKDVIARLDQGGDGSPGPEMPWQQGQNSVLQDGEPKPPAPPGPQAASEGSQFADAAQTAPRFGQVPQSPPEPQQQRSAQLPALPALTGQDGGGARGIYDASYQSFVRNDLAKAELGFRNFVSSFPDDPLATNAYYWLGRTYYDRQQYEQAAKAFLAGYKRDKKSAIAADSLLHLGLSLASLGEKDAACSTLSAVPRQYPEAPAQLRQNATDAMKKTRC